MSETHVTFGAALVAFVVGAAALTGAVAAGATAEHASITFEDQQATEEVTIKSVTLPDGGYVVVKNESNAVVGHSSYLEAGNYTNVTVTVDPAFQRGQVALAEAHRDDGDQSWDNATIDGGYLNENNRTVTDIAYITVGETESRAAASPTATATATATTTATDEQTPTATATETATTGPGFGVVAGLVALAGTAFVLRRD